jgi:hypothetical protein
MSNSRRRESAISSESRQGRIFNMLEFLAFFAWVLRRRKSYASTDDVSLSSLSTLRFFLQLAKNIQAPNAESGTTDIAMLATKSVNGNPPLLVIAPKYIKTIDTTTDTRVRHTRPSLWPIVTFWPHPTDGRPKTPEDRL